MKRSHSIAVSLFVVAGLISTACEPEEEDASPTPAPVPELENARLIHLTVSEEQVDVDGNGTVDTNLSAALDEMEAAILDYVESSLVTSCAVGEPPAYCEDISSILSGLEVYLDTVLTAEAVSDAIDQPISNGATYILNSLEYFPGEEGMKATLSSFQSFTWNEELNTFDGQTAIGVQTGSLDANGLGSLGPADLQITLQVSDANGAVEDTLLVIQDAINTLLTRDVNGWTSTTTGAISAKDIATIFVNTIWPIIDALPVSDDLDTEEMTTVVYDAILANCTIDLNGDGLVDSFGIALNGQAQFY